MQLTVPQRTTADSQSFPVEPDGVSQWLAKLNPAKSLNDAREVYRGLRHSNRLQNDLNRRRAIVTCFVPTLRELNHSLLEICQAQPLPLTDEFQRIAQLLDGLIREEAFAFKILLAESPQPRGDDIRRAMQALVRQAESRIYCYKDISEALLADAHQLYELAEEFNLLDVTPAEDKRSSADLYSYILLLTLADCRQHRVRQLRPLMTFLEENAGAVRIRKNIPTESALNTNYAVHLQHGARPVPATSLVVESNARVRWFNLSNILTRIDTQLAKSKSQEAALLGSESLDRQSYARLRVTFARSRQRRSQRGIRHEHQVVMLGHKAICAHLKMNAAKAAGLGADQASDDLVAGYEAMNKDVPQQQEAHNWTTLNHSPQGAALFNPNCQAGSVQVGDLVSINTPTDNVSNYATGKSKAFIGVVRWVIAGDGSAIRMGVEYLAKGVLPIGIARTHSDDITADDGMIVACRVKDSILQTMLLPAYLYQTGDRLTVTLNGKSRQVKLNQSLQSNGLFSHFSVLDVKH